MQTTTKRRSQYKITTLAFVIFIILAVLLNVYIISGHSFRSELIMAQHLHGDDDSSDRFSVKTEVKTENLLKIGIDLKKGEQLLDNKNNLVQIEDLEDSHARITLNATKVLPTVEDLQGSEPLDESKGSAAMGKASILQDDTNMLPNKEATATIAYAISLTGCGPFFPEAAAVLKHSIHLNSHPSNAGSNYAYKMYVFAHPSTTGCLKPFRKLGYEVLLKETPVDVTDIEGEFLREKVVKTGCCGEKEFLKLYAYTLTEHSVVVHLDLDSLVVQPLDDLFDAMLGEGDGGASVPVMFGKPLPEKIEAFFTRDYNMVNPGKKDVGVQGGFIVIRPNLDYFEEYKKIILKGDFVPMQGWAGRYGGYFGAQQIQGLCAYFYDGLHPGTAVELDRCIYNSMVDSPYHDKKKNKDGSRMCRDGRDQCDDCKKTDVSLVKSVHFTLCAKPWVCPTYKILEPNCKAFHHKWFSIRKDYEENIGVNGTNIGSHQTDTFLGYCKGGGERNYIPMMKIEEV